MSSLPQYWKKIDDPRDGVFELVMLTSFAIDGNPEDRRVLYVCKSLEGGLSESFEWKDVGVTWHTASKP